MLHHAKLVILETWNELHEGTEICATKETGTRYLDLTRTWIARLMAGSEPPPVPELRWPFARQRQDTSWGANSANRDQVAVEYAGAQPEESGLRAVAWQDGPFEIDAGRLRAQRRGLVGYVYFQVADVWQFETAADYELELEAEVDGPFGIEFDALEPSTLQGGAYTSAKLVRRSGQKYVFALEHALLGNRQNGRSDLRLVLHGRIAVKSLRLSRQ